MDDLLEERESWVSVSINWEGNLERDWNANCSVLGVLYRGRGVIAGIFFSFLFMWLFDGAIGKANWKRFSLVKCWKGLLVRGMIVLLLIILDRQY